MLTFPTGGKGQAEISGKSGAVNRDSRANAAPALSGGKYSKKFNDMGVRGWMEDAEGNEQSISPYYESRCGGTWQSIPRHKNSERAAAAGLLRAA